MTSTTCPVPVLAPPTATPAVTTSQMTGETTTQTTAGRLRVTGLWCTSCAHALEKVFSRQPGVVDVHVSFAAGEAAVRFDARRTSLAQIAASASAAGYGATVADDDTDDADDAVAASINDLAVRFAASLVFGMWAMAAAWALLAVDDLAPRTTLALARLAVIAALPVVFFSGAPFLRAGWRTARVGAPGMDALVALGTLLSLSLSVWHVVRGESVVYVDTATMLVTLLLAGRLIEHVARRQGARAIRDLLFGLPGVARRRDAAGLVTEVLARSVEVGDTIVADHDEVLALDAVVIAGIGEVSAAAVSGEAAPVSVAPGSTVLAGSRVVAGHLELRVIAAVGARRLDTIAARARDLLVARDGLATVAERAARLLVPVVLVLAVVSGIAVVVSGAGVEAALLRAVAVIVVTCPCALGLATPAALLQATASARRVGIVFRDVRALEDAARLQTVAFDKTGTLTTGRLRVHDVVVEVDGSRADIVALAAAVEGDVQHPVADALRVAGGHTARPIVSERVVTPGEGVQGRVDGRWVQVRRDQRPRDDDALAVSVLVDGAHQATITFHDDVRDDAAAAIAALQQQGIRVVMLSGDRQVRAVGLGRTLGLRDDDIHGGLSPEDKLAHIERLQRTGRVAFVGDGDNDAAALAPADLGIAVHNGTRAALQAAPVVLQQPGIAVVGQALVLARRTSRVMRENLAFAVVFNAVVVPLAVAGQVSPLYAAVAMGTSSLVVTLNALRARTT